MNQEKIGKFIAELRKEQNMTQRELAEKLGVSINAVSKWERGICLMDISLLKPLSKNLKVSITEIINGERLSEDNVRSKTEEAIESTIRYSNKKIKKTKKKSQIILFAVVIIGLLTCFFCYKGIAAYIYTAEVMEEKYYATFTNGLKNQDEMSITYESVSDDNYIVYDDMKIRNDFTLYTKVDDTEEYESIKYQLYDETGNFKAAFWFGTSDTYVDWFASETMLIFGDVNNNAITNNLFDIDNMYNSADKNNFLEENNIVNDIDFFQFVKDNYYLKNNIFMSVSEMKQNFAYNTFVKIMATSLNKFTIIEGKYDGYMFTYAFNIPTKEVNILKNDKRYVFTFIGEEFTDAYIKDLLNTLVIE